MAKLETWLSRSPVSQSDIEINMSNQRFNLRVSEGDLDVLNDALEALAGQHHKAFSNFCYRFNTQPESLVQIERESDEWKSLKRDNEILGRLKKQIEYQKKLVNSKIKFGGVK